MELDRIRQNLNDIKRRMEYDNLMIITHFDVCQLF